MDRLPNDIRNIDLNPEAIAKSDKDIQTIMALSALARNEGAKLALTGGYATEALCGGTIARPHGDIDARFIFDTPVGTKTGRRVFDGVWQILEAEDTSWEIKNPHPGHVEYIESGGGRSDFERRRLDVGIPVKGFYDVEFEEATLSDSHGETVAVTVVAYEDLVADKINKLYSLREKVNTDKDRHPSITDHFDLKRLLSLPRFEKDKVFEKLAKLTRSSKKAREEWIYISHELLKQFLR